MQQPELVLSGGIGRPAHSARAGFIPIPLERVPVAALSGLEFYVRSRPEPRGDGAEPAPEAWFRLYTTAEDGFDEAHRRRLLDNNILFVYLPVRDQAPFQRQLEAALTDAAGDPGMALPLRSVLVYETCVEVVNELMANPADAGAGDRVDRAARAITTLVLSDPGSFAHLFAASRHDFYTATHMVNVAAWMVSLAHGMGIRDAAELRAICQAGLLHDIGKVGVPEAVLNKTGPLTPRDWEVLKRHPALGAEYVQRFRGLSPLVATVARQHHERADGSGYPDGVTGDQIALASRICAVVDSFDGMTAFRPFKERTCSIDEALGTLRGEAPARYDSAVVEAWTRLVRAAQAFEAMAWQSPEIPGETPDEDAGMNQRLHERRTFHCPARVHLLRAMGNRWDAGPGAPVVAHSISRGGLGLLSQLPIVPGEFVRVFIMVRGWENRALEGVAVRCRSHTDMWHEIGIQFTSVEAAALARAA